LLHVAKGDIAAFGKRTEQERSERPKALVATLTPYGK
jgi:hypothetical protein